MQACGLYLEGKTAGFTMLPPTLWATPLSSLAAVWPFGVAFKAWAHISQ